MNELKGSWDATGLNFAIVVSSFNEVVTKKLLEGAVNALEKCGADLPYIVWVPGAFEIPLIAKKLAQSRKFDAVICLGAVIRGQTNHYDYVCSQASSGILNAGLSTDVPVSFGLLTCDTTEQALDRAGLKSGNKGAEAALTAIEMVSIVSQIETALPENLQFSKTH